jgi:poly(3-hydroxybutyrate) depolymerase
VKSSNISLSIVLGVAGVALGGCHLYNNDNDNTACAGYLGCSAELARGADGGNVGISPSGGDGGVVARDFRTLNQGCGKALPQNQVPTVPGKPDGYTHYTVMATGATLEGTIPAKAGPRTFWVRVPVDYNPAHKYRTLYIGQGCGGYGIADTSTLQFYKESEGGSEEAIYVALDIPTDNANMDCYDNNAGPKSQEWEAFQLFQDVVDSTYCVDDNRVYISGYSTGGWLTDMWGCYFAGDGLHPWNGVPGPVPTSNSESAPADLTSRSNSVSLDGSAGETSTSEAGAEDASMSIDAPASEAGGAGGGGGAGGSGGVGGAGGGGGEGGAGGAYVPLAGARLFAPDYHIRIQAGVSGGEPDNNPPCNGPIAAIWIHDLMDSNPYSQNYDVALPRVLKMNGCGKQANGTIPSPDNQNKAPWHEDIMGKGVCKQFIDCPKNYPVVFCTTDGLGHADQHGIAIPGYTKFFDEAEAAAGLQSKDGTGIQ